MEIAPTRLAFIGKNLDAHKIIEALSSCVLTNRELEEGILAWCSMPDSFHLSKRSQVHAEVDHHDDDDDDDEDDDDRHADHKGEEEEQASPSKKKSRKEALKLGDALQKFDRILSKVDEKQKHKFCQLISTKVYQELLAQKGGDGDGDGDGTEISKKKDKLALVIQEVRKAIESSDTFKQCNQEKIFYPKIGQFAGYNPKNTLEVDSFLLTDDQVDELAEQGEIARYYCEDCGSKNTKPLSEQAAGRRKDMEIRAKKS